MELSRGGPKPEKQAHRRKHGHRCLKAGGVEFAGSRILQYLWAFLQHCRHFKEALVDDELLLGLRHEHVGSSWDLITTVSWAYNPTYDPPT